MMCQVILFRTFLHVEILFNRKQNFPMSKSYVYKILEFAALRPVYTIQHRIAYPLP